MEIKEKDLYLAKLLEENAIKQDEFEDIEFKPEINAFCSKYLSAIFIDNINFGWSVWQAKATPEGFVLVPRELSDEEADDQAMFAWNFNLDLFKSDNRDMTAIQIEEFRLKWCLNKARTLQQDYKAMIEAQEQSHDC